MNAKAVVFLAGIAAVSAWAAEGMFERKLTVSGAVDLDVVSDSGRVTIRAGGPGTLRVVGRIKTGTSWHPGLSPEEKVKRLEAAPPIEQSGNTVRIGHIRDRELDRNVSISYEIEAPADSTVRSRTDSGSQLIEGIHGPVDAAADSGGIEIADAGNEVHATSDSGSLRLRGVRGPLTAKADSGSITGSAIAGSIDAASDSGEIQMEQTAASPIKIRSDSGSVTLRLPSSGGYDVSASSDIGHISSDLPLTVRGTAGHNRLQGQLRGGGASLVVTTDSGSIRLQ